MRRSAVVLTALLALAAPLLQPVTAHAATAVSSVSVTDPTGDTVVNHGTTHVDAPKADITAASARYQNGFVTFTMKLVQGDGLLDANSLLYWTVNTSTQSCCTNFVSLRKGSNGAVKVVMDEPHTPSVNGDASRDCPGSAVSLDLALGTYLASLPVSCISPDALPSFMWSAQREVPIANSTDVATDGATAATQDAPTAGTVTNMNVTGYWAIGSDGKVYPFGDATNNGAPASASLSIVDIEASPHGTGYWAVDDKGAVTNFGPVNYGSATDLKSGERVTSISGTPTGAGYWLFTNKGRAIAFGDANKNIGDVSTLKLNAEILDSAPTPTGNGYYLVAADGGVFALGDAHYQGSMGSTKLNKPVQSIVVDPDGEGYWLVASDGGVFSFKAPFRGSTGSMTLNKPMTGMVAFGNGYLMVAEDGGVFNFSDKQFSGSLGSNPPANPIVSISALG
ncbi:MAG TPA: hypothetical protein VFE55_20050 [Acidimicrobiia bacterium]|nr:hypothetical protein [Acidimicrobiia bacterium]